MSHAASSTRSRRAWPKILAAGVAAALLVVAWLARPVEAPGEARGFPTFEPLPVVLPAGCGEPDQGPFVPNRIAIPGIIDEAPVLALARDDEDLPGTPPDADPRSFGWDQPPGLLPGSERGNVLLNTHTWQSGAASGNALLRDLHVGTRIVLSGPDGLLCYDVTERLEVLAEDGYVPYYDRDGDPQLAIVVCSGERRGPGDWSHRTIWFATPLTA